MSDASQTENEVVPKTRESVHTEILNWFSDKPKGKVLDAPGGYGHLAMHLKQQGHDVTCGEIDPDIFKVPDISCIYTDLNRKIDAEDETYDYICCVDGLEHMTDPYTAVAEFSRILKPGGYGIFSIPNYSNIEKRMQFLLRGYLTKPHSVEEYHDFGANLFNFHNSPLTITLLDLMFSINGFKIELILRDKVKRKQLFFLPLVWLLKLADMTTSDRRRQKHHSAMTLRDDVLMGGNTQIFITRKSSI